MELLILFLATCVAASNPARAHATQSPLLTRPLLPHSASSAKEPKLKGKFLHITDIHPDPYYKIYSSTKEGHACHRGSGPAGTYGAETSDCDSPIALVNATFKWIDDHLKDEIDFVIWTGDSARHDNDEHFPRNEKQVLGQNKMLVEKFREVFGVDKKTHGSHRPGPQPAMRIPVVPSFGNNDILPHNIFEKGPNHWTKLYETVWRPFIPEEQRHGFDRGGWFYVEVIPGKLAVFSLNTMYFFDSNSAVDGCGSRKEPGFEHMEWLRIQLQFLRERGMKAIISGHVPPARNDEKVGWDETCWQKYALWMQQYRDVVVGSMYGHMNIEHFVLQDFEDIDLKVAALGYDTTGVVLDRGSSQYAPPSTSLSDNINIMVNTQDYLKALRDLWSKLPTPPNTTSTDALKRESSRSREEKYHDIIGGEFAERFSLSLISASVVPNFFSTIRVFEYNITGLEDTAPWQADFVQPAPAPWDASLFEDDEDTVDLPELKRRRLLDLFTTTKKKHKKPKFTAPLPPSSSSPPGPAYSPQPLSLISYKQYIANNTWINHDLSSSSLPAAAAPRRSGRTDGRLKTRGWNEGKHASERPEKRRGSNPKPREFAFDKWYDTADADDAYGLAPKRGGLVMRRWVELASRIGKFDDGMEDDAQGADEASSLDYADGGAEANVDVRDDDDGDAEAQKHKKHKKKKKKHRHKKTSKKEMREIVRVWYAFVSRAVTGTMDKAELRDEFGSSAASEAQGRGATAVATADASASASAQDVMYEDL